MRVNADKEISVDQRYEVRVHQRAIIEGNNTMPCEHQKTILVVDDESHICLMMEDLLMDEYNVLTARDGVEALEIVAEKQDAIDLVITDIRMPRMNGMELLKEMKTHYPRIGVMMISAHGNIRTAVDAMRQGAYDYIPKPLPEFDELDITISRYFEKRDLEERLLQQERAEMERIYQELEDARQIQQSLFPKEPPQIQGFEIAAASLPAREVSGDFYDFLALGDKIGIVLADVTGKSVKAAMVAAMASGMLRMQVEGRSDIWDSPRMIFNELNVALRPRLIHGMFVTVCLGILSAKEKHLLLSNVGLPYPIVKRGEKTWELEVNGLPLGILDDAEYTDLAIDLEAGDFVVFYSDGISEAMDEREEIYQSERLLERVRKADPGLSAQGMMDWITQDVTAFMGDMDTYDDITLAVLRCDSVE
jgi:sigma-B regulation protein RsbU (phosphoserine phosphatase)